VVRVELEDTSSDWCALLVECGSQAFCTHELDLLVLLAPHLRHAYREPRIRGVLTPRECEVLRLVGEGLTNRQVARRLGIAPGTVRSHLEHTY
jgi:DNA-binding NarL/FixJ family response regulator